MRGTTSPGRRQLEGLSQPTPDGGWSGGAGRAGVPFVVEFRRGPALGRVTNSAQVRSG